MHVEKIAAEKKFGKDVNHKNTCLKTAKNLGSKMLKSFSSYYYTMLS